MKMGKKFKERIIYAARRRTTIRMVVIVGLTGYIFVKCLARYTFRKDNNKKIALATAAALISAVAAPAPGITFAGDKSDLDIKIKTSAKTEFEDDTVYVAHITNKGDETLEEIVLETKGIKIVGEKKLKGQSLEPGESIDLGIVPDGSDASTGEINATSETESGQEAGNADVTAGQMDNMTPEEPAAENAVPAAEEQGEETNGSDEASENPEENAGEASEDDNDENVDQESDGTPEDGENTDEADAEGSDVNGDGASGDTSADVDETDDIDDQEDGSDDDTEAVDESEETVDESEEAATDESEEVTDEAETGEDAEEESEDEAGEGTEEESEEEKEDELEIPEDVVSVTIPTQFKVDMYQDGNDMAVSTNDIKIKNNSNVDIDVNIKSVDINADAVAIDDDVVQARIGTGGDITYDISGIANYGSLNLNISEPDGSANTFSVGEGTTTDITTFTIPCGDNDNKASIHFDGYALKNLAQAAYCSVDIKVVFDVKVH